MSSVTVEIRDAGVILSLDRATEFATMAVAEQALMDCNFYCKQDTETLIKSSHIHSDMDKGVLRWVTPYAEMQYNLPATRTDRNPNATYQWCETAHSNHGDEWERVFINALHRGGA